MRFTFFALCAVASLAACTTQTTGVSGPNTLSGGTSVADQKQCCFNGACSNVDDDITECDVFETAQTCDDNGQNCTGHGGSSFP